MPNSSIDLSKISREELLNLRICDLPLAIKGTWLCDCIQQLYQELTIKGIKFRPSCYLADEWLCPDEEPVIGVPFFLAHPALMKLEKEMMFEVEGGTKDSCMKLLRHEAGHAINYAYRLHKRNHWQNFFGPFSKEYTDTYRFRPYSKRFVRHLEHYYAQYHPDEDFSETFAVWLTLGFDWQKKYSGWRALDKLKYVDTLMQKIKDKKPKVTRGRRYWSLASLRITLKNYYKRKRHFHAEEFPDFHDASLQKMFVTQSEQLFTTTAAELIKKNRKGILERVSLWTGEKRYIIHSLLNKLIKRCQKLYLVVRDDEEKAFADFLTYVTTLVVSYKYTGRLVKK